MKIKRYSNLIYRRGPGWSSPFWLASIFILQHATVVIALIVRDIVKFHHEIQDIAGSGMPMAPRSKVYSTTSQTLLPQVGVVPLIFLVLGVLAGNISLSDTVSAQQYYPLSQHSPVGMAAQWVGQTGLPRPQYLQPVQVHLPSTGSITFFARSPHTAPSPAQADLAVAQVFRLRLADMPEFPAVELYPTIEMIDHLHPPQGEKQQFPVKLQITEAEIQKVLDGGLVTKVLYLETPQLALPAMQKDAAPTTLLPGHMNALEEADRVGRPMLLFRMGGRTPDGLLPNSEFFTPYANLVGSKVTEESHTGIARAVSETSKQDQNSIRQTAARRIKLNPNGQAHSELEAFYQAYPDEYIADGGDRAWSAHFRDGQLQDFDTEDTVAEFTNQLGERHLTTSNRVVIYSPRFRAMSVHQQPFTRTALKKLGGVKESVKGVGMDALTAVDAKTQKMQADGIRMRSRGSELEQKTSFAGVEQQTYITGHTKLLNVYQDMQYVQAGRFDKLDRMKLISGLQAAFAWSETDSPIVTASTSGGVELTARFQAAEIVGVELDKGAPGRLRIVKMADTKTAVPGDIVTFTIRYDNLGDHAVNSVVISDHLTPRLELIKNSFESDRPGSPELQETDEGTVILKFHLEGNLEPKTGGSLTFQAKVR